MSAPSSLNTAPSTTADTLSPPGSIIYQAIYDETKPFSQRHACKTEIVPSLDESGESTVSWVKDALDIHLGKLTASFNQNEQARSEVKRQSKFNPATTWRYAVGKAATRLEEVVNNTSHQCPPIREDISVATPTVFYQLQQNATAETPDQWFQFESHVDRNSRNNPDSSAAIAQKEFQQRMGGVQLSIKEKMDSEGEMGENFAYCMQLFDRSAVDIADDITRKTLVTFAALPGGTLGNRHNHS
nr:uncharacterized protein CI109_006337 [Kwoniella shandongensis]KAA5525358.1 hypothetical protein CI109_006337 [Kwoniella shandongensis]